MARDIPPTEAQETGRPNFSRTLDKHGLRLTRDATTTLQVNVGLLCNQTCRHCHLDAGPKQTEIMSKETAAQVAEWARRCRFATIDITGLRYEASQDPSRRLRSSRRGRFRATDGGAIQGLFSLIQPHFCQPLLGLGLRPREFLGRGGS